MAHPFAALDSLRKIFSSFSATQFSAQQLEIHGELKSIETLLGLPFSKDDNVLKELNSELSVLAAELALYTGNQTWPFSSGQQREILMKLARLKSSLLTPNAPISTTVGGTENGSVNQSPGLDKVQLNVTKSTFRNVGGSVLSNNNIHFDVDPAVREGVDRLVDGGSR
ncbi:hypothetical protein C8J56DRAFT_570412 [Mycena floridula]|nr:hypothetical protein C8J56DRAFT_570412 [Mycena floridula]